MWTVLRGKLEPVSHSAALPHAGFSTGLERLSTRTICPDLLCLVGSLDLLISLLLIQLLESPSHPVVPRDDETNVSAQWDRSVSPPLGRLQYRPTSLSVLQVCGSCSCGMPPENGDSVVKYVWSGGGKLHIQVHNLLSIMLKSKKSWKINGFS